MLPIWEALALHVQINQHKSKRIAKLARFWLKVNDLKLLVVQRLFPHQFIRIANLQLKI